MVLKDNVISSVAYNHVVVYFIDADWTSGRDSRPGCSQGIVVAHVIRHRLCGHPYYPNGTFFSIFEVLAFDHGLERVMSDYLI